MRRARHITSVEVARSIARKRLPRAVFDFVDGAADGEVTMAANRAAIDAVELVPRLGVTRGVPALATTVLGQQLSMPLLLSPVGLAGMVHRSGDLAAARASQRAGIVNVQSSVSTHTIEDVVAAGPGGWFQLYFLGGRRGAEQLIDRAKAAGSAVLVVTMDTQISGKRERDLGHRLTLPVQWNPANLLRLTGQFAPHPGWLYRFLRGGFDLAPANLPAITLPEAMEAMTRETPTWEDLDWIKQRWDGPLVVKGVLSAQDARRAVGAGADAVIVSNHGGRQLDGVAPSFRALVEVVDAVGDSAEVLVDSGIRRGADIAKAISLGARAAMIGRPWLFGLASGEAGVTRVIETLRDDLDRTLRLLGCPDVNELDRSYLRLAD